MTMDQFHGSEIFSKNFQYSEIGIWLGSKYKLMCLLSLYIQNNTINNTMNWEPYEDSPTQLHPHRKWQTVTQFHVLIFEKQRVASQRSKYDECMKINKKCLLYFTMLLDWLSITGVMCLWVYWYINRIFLFLKKNYIALEAIDHVLFVYFKNFNRIQSDEQIMHMVKSNFQFYIQSCLSV